MRRLEVLKAVITQNGQWKLESYGMETNKSEKTIVGTNNPQKWKDFILAFVRENEALDTYWRRALDSIPQPLEQTNTSETAFSE